MIPDQLIARAPESTVEWDAYYKLRWEVLRQPWAQPRGSERDEQEDAQDVAHRMVMAKGKALAVGRLHVSTHGVGQVRYMAVSPARTGAGLGSIVLRSLESAATDLGLKRIILNARESAVTFYEKHDYATIGPAPSRYGIPHRSMQKTL